ncbi:MAG: ATP-binding protein [Desulfuromonadales bacterium]|nr:ATP-binding protein [Desulfuromonadales bacterium]
MCKQSSTWPPVPASLTPILAWVRECLTRFGVANQTVQQLTLISEEVVVNSINYAQADSQSQIELTLAHNDDGVLLELADYGKAFNPLETEDPDTDLPLMEREQGGLGIFFVKQIADRVEYRRDDGKNILTVWKEL